MPLGGSCWQRLAAAVLAALCRAAPRVREADQRVRARGKAARTPLAGGWRGALRCGAGCPRAARIVRGSVSDSDRDFYFSEFAGAMESEFQRCASKRDRLFHSQVQALKFVQRQV